MAQCATCVLRLYKSVIEEVMANVRDSFLDEGIDEQVLLEVKAAWEQKLTQTRVTDHNDLLAGQQQQQLQQTAHQQVASGLTGQPGATSTAAPSTVTPPVAPPAAAVNLVPVQITVPAQQAGGTTKTITIHVPSTALANGVAGAQLQTILSAPSAAQTFAMEASQAADVIQRQLNTALQRRGITLPPQLLQFTSQQLDGATDCQCTCQAGSGVQQNSPAAVAGPGTLDSLLLERLAHLQVDGACDDSSDEMSADDDDDDDDKEEEDDKDKKFGDEEEDEEDPADVNEDPLNSADDVSDDESSEAFDTDNVVVCQYDKITRVRNKWRFNLKDGIMNLKGKDYVFLKATGEGEW